MLHWVARVWVTRCTRSILVGSQVWQCHGKGLLIKRDQYVELSFAKWLQCQDVGLLEFDWHDKRDQHGWVAKCGNAMVMGYW